MDILNAVKMFFLKYNNICHVDKLPNEFFYDARKSHIEMTPGSELYIHRQEGRREKRDFRNVLDILRSIFVYGGMCTIYPIYIHIRIPFNDKNP